jgi:hypothetical protein
VNDGEENIDEAAGSSAAEESPVAAAPAEEPAPAPQTPAEPAVPVTESPVEAAPAEDAGVVATAMETAPVPAMAFEGAPFIGPPVTAPPMTAPPAMGPGGYPGYGPPPPMPAGPPRRRSSLGLRLVALGVLNVVLATVALAAVVHRNRSDDHPVAAAAPSAAPVVTPWSRVTDALRLSADALVSGDEQGWMAAVDPAATELRTRYQGIYQSLRTLGVTSFEYQPGIYTSDSADPSIFTFAVSAYYCYGTDTCHGDPDVPGISQKLTMKPIAGKYVITKSAVAASSDIDGPTPWQDGGLKFITGKRVVMGADSTEAKLLPSALPLAEMAAVVADKFAAIMGTTQLKYRIYLAGKKQWKTWYGGATATWTSRSVSLGQYGFDVIINVDQISDVEDLQFALQRELGWAISLTGSSSYSGSDEAWLTEGVSEYIGFYPKTAASEWYMSYVRKSVNSHPLTKFNPTRPADSASDASWNTFFGLAHLAIDCMAHQYGQQKTFTFVKQAVINGENYDDASQDAFHLRFSAVDKTCVGWIKNQL